MFGRIQDNSKNEPKLMEDEAYNIVETAILKDKCNYNRVRNTNARFLRHKYGKYLVNKVIHTINNRHSRQLCYSKLKNGEKNTEKSPNILEELI